VVGKLFGQRYVNPDSSSRNFRTALSWAATNDREGIVKLLLNRKDVNPNALDTKSGQTPLSWTAQKGYQGIVKLVLGRNC